MSFDRGTKWCCHVLLLAWVLVGCAWLCMVTVSLLAGSEPVVRPIFPFDMDADDATQTSARNDIQHPRLEYAVWQGREWVRIYTPGQPQLWHPDDELPALPENTFRECQAKHGLFEIGNIKDINGYCPESCSTHHAPDQPLIDVQNPDMIQVEEMFTYAPPISDGDRPTALQLLLVFYGGTRLAHLGDLSPPSSERPRSERAVSRSPRRSGFFGRR